MTAIRPIVGRDAELSELDRALGEAAEGRGGVWFASGEPGIGKTRLVEEMATRGASAGVGVYWGRCWEAGGAPAYFPWIEVLRALLRTRGDPLRGAEHWTTRAGILAQLMPELAREAAEGAPMLDADRARFQLLEAVVSTLCDAARETTLLVIVEDLHVADAATISVLSLLGEQARNARLLVMGTLRDADARMAASGGALLDVVQRSRCLTLRRLDRKHVGEFLELASGSEPSPAICEAIHRTTEGNPLFVTEMARLMLGHSDWQHLAAGSVAVPRSIRHAIRARLAHLPERTRGALEIASVIGREFRAPTLSELSGRALSELSGALTEALDAGVLLETAPGRYRFSHVLIREVLHMDASEERRALLHVEVADILRRRAGGEPVWTEIAHHLLEAGPEVRSGAVAACREAAREALRQLAFGDAAEWYTRALGALGQDPSADLHERGELLLCLADARAHSGEIEAGQTTCMRAVALARELRDGDLLARAALAYGAVLQIAVVDPTLVTLLREALTALPASDGKTRAVVMARLAAAEQPSPEPEASFALAREAIALARASAEPRTLLDTLRFAISALMDLAPPKERAGLNREYVQLAESLREPVEALRGTMRLVFDHLELGDVAQVDASIEAVCAGSQRLGHPFYAWRASSFRAMQASFRGDFVAAREHLAQAELLGSKGGDPNAARAVSLQRYTLARLRGADDDLAALLPDLASRMHGSELGALVVRIMTAEALVRRGLPEQAALHAEPKDLFTIVRYGDLSFFAGLGNVALALGFRDVAEAAREVAGQRHALFSSGGMMMMSFGEPLSYVLATLHRATDRLDEAEQLYERAIARARDAGGRPFACWACHDLAELLIERGGAARLARARALLDAVIAEATELDQPGLVQRAGALASRAAAPDPELSGKKTAPSSETAFARLTRDGESWVVTWGDASVRLQHSKGVQWLSELVREPGRDFHVLDLVAAGDARDVGDAGEWLDADARKAYRERARELRDEIEVAGESGDGGRLQVAQKELEFLQDELARALGLGGRQRRAAAAGERARINVQRRLRDAVRRIETQHAELGRHLDRSLKTGLFCSYRP